MGLTADMVDQYLELYDAFDTGRIVQGLPDSPTCAAPRPSRSSRVTVIKPLVG